MRRSRRPSISPRAETGAPQVWEQAAGNVCYDWHLGDLGAGRRGARQGGAGRQARPDQQPAGAQRDGAARAIGEFNRATNEFTLYTTSQTRTSSDY